MASLLISAGYLSYIQIRKSTQKRRAKKAAQTSAFSDLERENAARIAHLQDNTCFCQQSDWQGGGCEVHGYVPAAGEPGGPPAYMEVEGRDEGDGRGEGGPPVYEGGRRGSAPGVMEQPQTTRSGSPGAGESPYQYCRGQEDGFLAEPEQHRARHSAVDLLEGARAPAPMREEEVRRINEERRKRMRAGGFANFVLRWKKNKPKKGEEVVA